MSKEIPRKSAREQVGDDPGVRAAEKEGAGLLAFGDEALVVLTEPRKGLAAEPPEAFHEQLRHALLTLA
jgi:hypothetical protein